MFTKKVPSRGYGNSRYKPKTVWRPSQFYNGNPYTNKTLSSYWLEAPKYISGILHTVLGVFCLDTGRFYPCHYNDVIIGAIMSQITSVTIAYSTVYSDADERKHQSSASLAFVWGIHRWPVTSPHKWPVTRKLFPFDDVIMSVRIAQLAWHTCGSTLARVMNGLTIPSHYLNQCLVIISKPL